MDLDSAEESLRQRMIADKGRYTVCVDVDGTLAEYQGWKSYTQVGAPIKSMVGTLRAIIASRPSVYIIVHTCRVTTVDNKIIPAAVETLTRWLKTHEVPYDEIWMGTGKPYANVYIDDMAANPNCGECRSRFYDQTVKTK